MREASQDARVRARRDLPRSASRGRGGARGAARRRDQGRRPGRRRPLPRGRARRDRGALHPPRPLTDTAHVLAHAASSCPTKRWSPRSSRSTTREGRQRRVADPRRESSSRRCPTAPRASPSGSASARGKKVRPPRPAARPARRSPALANENAQHAFREKRRAADDVEERLAQIQGAPSAADLAAPDRVLRHLASRRQRHRGRDRRACSTGSPTRSGTAPSTCGRSPRATTTARCTRCSRALPPRPRRRGKRSGGARERGRGRGNAGANRLGSAGSVRRRRRPRAAQRRARGGARSRAPRAAHRRACQGEGHSRLPRAHRRPTTTSDERRTTRRRPPRRSDPDPTPDRDPDLALDRPDRDPYRPTPAPPHRRSKRGRVAEPRNPMTSSIASTCRARKTASPSSRTARPSSFSRAPATKRTDSPTARASGSAKRAAFGPSSTTSPASAR